MQRKISASEFKIKCLQLMQATIVDLRYHMKDVLAA